MRQLATNKGAEAIFLFIAELNGFKKGTVQEKKDYGIECYLNRTLHDLDFDTEEDRKDAHENIWLERLYDELDKYYQLTNKTVSKKLALAKGTVDELLSNPREDFYWAVPIEADASALA